MNANARFEVADEPEIGAAEHAFFCRGGEAMEEETRENERTLWSGGSLWLSRVTGAETGGRYALIEQRMPRVALAPPHRHEYEDQSFTVLEGEPLFALGEGDEERVVRAGAGSVV